MVGRRLWTGVVAAEVAAGPVENVAAVGDRPYRNPELNRPKKIFFSKSSYHGKSCL